jgi:hypothetical protein
MLEKGSSSSRISGRGAIALGECNPLLHPPRKLVGISIGGLTQSHEIQKLVDALAALCTAESMKPEPDVACDRQVGKQCKILEDHADMALLGRDAVSGFGNTPFAQKDFPATHGLEAGDGAQQRGFAAAARPEQASDHASFQDEGHIAHNQRIAVGDADVSNLKLYRHCGTW